MPCKIVHKLQHKCVCRQRPAIQQLKLRPVLKETGTMTSKSMDPFKVERGRLRELSWANKHTTHELAKDDSTHSGPSCTREVAARPPE